MTAAGSRRCPCATASTSSSTSRSTIPSPPEGPAGGAARALRRLGPAGAAPDRRHRSDRCRQPGDPLPRTDRPLRPRAASRSSATPPTPRRPTSVRVAASPWRMRWSSPTSCATTNVGGGRRARALLGRAGAAGRRHRPAGHARGPACRTPTTRRRPTTGTPSSHDDDGADIIDGICRRSCRGPAGEADGADADPRRSPPTSSTSPPAVPRAPAWPSRSTRLEGRRGKRLDRARSTTNADGRTDDAAARR